MPRGSTLVNSIMVSQLHGTASNSSPHHQLKASPLLSNVVAHGFAHDAIILSYDPLAS
jgi:hypothetical protein